MIPILYEATETAFDTNGIGILTDTISCNVVEELNGTYELTLVYPTKGILRRELVSERIILAKANPVAAPQPFRIYRRRPSSQGNRITVYARHVAYDLKGVVVEPFSASGVVTTMAVLPEKAVMACPFTFWTNKSAESMLNVPVPRNIWSLLGGKEGSILDQYGGEYEFDRFAVKLWKQRGEDRGVSVRYGKNLSTLEQDENIANCYTGVYPFWQSPEGQLVQLPERIVNAPGNHARAKIMPLDFSTEWMEAPTEEQLRERAERYVSDNDIGVPAISWKVQHVALEQTAEYQRLAFLEQISMGDTVRVEFPEMDVSASARAVATDFDSIREIYNSTTLGKVKADVAETIAGKTGQTDLKQSVEAGTKTAVETILKKENPMTGSFFAKLSTFMEPGEEEAQLILRYSVGLEEIAEDRLEFFDFNEDGVVNYQDALIALQAAKGLRTLSAWTKAVPSEILIRIDMSDPENFISVTGVNMWGREVVRKMGANTMMDAQSIIGTAYPAGSIYLRSDSESPVDILGGNWEELTDTGLNGIHAWKRVP